MITVRCAAVTILSFLACAAALSLAAGPATQPTPATQPAIAAAEPFTFEKSATYPYFCYKPAGYAADAKVPLVIYLHGMGNGSVKGVQQWGPPSEVAAGKTFPFLLIAPISANGAWWDGAKLLSFTKEVIAAYKVDPDRVYLTGVSMGGFGSWDLAIRAPELFAAVAPIAGGGDPTKVWKLQKLPVWAYHGGADEIVPESSSARAVEALRAAGGNVAYTVYPGQNHVCWPRVYTDGFYRELLLLRRPENIKPDRRAELSAFSADASNLSVDLLMPAAEEAPAPLTFHASNRAPVESKLDVKLTADGIEPSVREFTITVPPGGTVTKEIPATPTGASELPRLHLTWNTTYTEASQHYSIPSAQEYELSRPMLCPAGDPVKIDGDLSEWKGHILPCKPQFLFHKGEAPLDPKDCSLGVGFRHDDKNLYIAVQVTDDDVLAGKAPAGWWSYDVVSIRLDAGRDSRPDRKEGEDFVDVLPFVMSPTTVAGQEPMWERRRIPSEISFVCVKNSTGYAAEIAIPFKWLDAKAGHPWTSVRLNVGVTDRDSNGNGSELRWFNDWHGNTVRSRSGTLLRQ